MNRGIIAIGALAVLLLGAGLGVVLFTWASPRAADAPQVSSVLTPTTAPTPLAFSPTSTPVAVAPPGAVGSTGWTTRSGSEYDYRLVWVNRTGLFAWDRAWAERDDKAMDQVIRLYEQLEVETGTLVRVVNRDSEAIQVEMLDGRHAGRRGWLHIDSNALTAIRPVIQPTATTPPLNVAPGVNARLDTGSSVTVWIPTSRDLYGSWERSGFQEPSPPNPSWILASWNQTVRIVQVDGDAVLVEMTGGGFTGKQAWVPRRMLTR